MADDVSTKVRGIVERVLEADVQDQISRRRRELSAAVGDASDTVSKRAAELWREAEPTRREAERMARRASKEAGRWGRQTWKTTVEPSLRELWGRRAVALGAAGAAVPAGRELVEDAAVRLGMRRRRERRRWGAFLFGMLIGAVAGAVVAMLTAPKPGRQMRDELAASARDAAGRARVAAERAREAAGGAGDWVPLFQREGAEPVNGATGDEIAAPEADALSTEADAKADVPAEERDETA